MHNHSLILCAGRETSNSLDPTRGARCCRERVLRCPFPTQGLRAPRPNPYEADAMSARLPRAAQRER